MTAPIRTMPELIRDWWRGWSDEDLTSFLEKTNDPSAVPGMAYPITKREARAFLAYSRAKYRNHMQ